jgi:hypothetical protein
MNLVRKKATALGGILFAVILIAALVPKATRGVAATLVQVTNTAANPVSISAADSPANFPFAAPLCFSLESADCEVPRFTVPATTSTGLAVKRLVIENVSGTCALSPGISDFVLFLSTPVAGSSNPLSFALPLVPASPNNSAGQFVVGGSSVRIYTDPGNTVVIAPNAALAPNGNLILCNFVVAGHLETK